MKKVQNTIVIGVDHGYGNINTANRIFQSGVIKLKPGQEFGGIPLIYRNEKYLIGQGHKVFVADKFLDEDYYVLTLAAIAPFASSKVCIMNVGHIRYQECNRIDAIVKNLSKMGIAAIEQKDNVFILPGKPEGCLVETFDDHRVAMAFSLVGTVIDTPVFLPGESQRRGSLVGCRLWGHTESDTIEVT